ncbi:hypothetical protein [Streptomyces sp. IBSBF 2394]|uniref:hypothetical protein n=1 Tax=Streptomyces sp. IBSBF 2394 TaxID=2903532 RepID=UPI002FDC34C0
MAPEINSALDHPDPRQAVERVKDVVQRRLLDVYPTARIVRTDFFNHTYVPDLLMTWSSGAHRSERRVYLRASGDPGLLASDVQLLGREQQSLVVPLAQLGTGPAREQLEAVAEERHTLVLDPCGLGALPARTPTRTPTALASDAIVEGGRGIIGAGQVDRFLYAVGTGVEAAREGRTEPTRLALSQVSRHTVPDVSRRLSTLMAAMWQGSGRSLSGVSGQCAPPGVSRRDLAEPSAGLSGDQGCGILATYPTARECQDSSADRHHGHPQSPALDAQRGADVEGARLHGGGTRVGQNRWSVALGYRKWASWPAWPWIRGLRSFQS